MKKDNKKNVIIYLLILVRLILLIFIGLLITGTISFSESKQDSVESNNKQGSNVDVIM